MFRFFSRARDEAMIIFDINAESVGAAVLLTKPGAIPRVIYMCREYFQSGKAELEETAIARQVIDSMLEALSRTQAFLTKNILSHSIFRSYMPQRACYTFSFPWLESKMKTIKVEWPQSMLVTEKLLASLVSKEAASFSDELAKNDSGESFVVVEKKITSIRLNGYEVDEPYGKRARSLELSMCMSALPKEIYDATSSAWSGVGKFRENSYASLATAATDVVGKNTAEKDFVVLDILSSATQAFIVRRGALSSCVSIPAGEDVLTSALAKHFSFSRAEARSYTRMFFGGYMEKKISESIKRIITEAEIDWRKQFEDAVNAAARKIAIPPSFFVIARRDEAPFFLRSLGSGAILEFGVDKVPVRETLLTHDFLKSRLSIDQSVSGDPALSLLSAYFTSSSGAPGK